MREPDQRESEKADGSDSGPDSGLDEGGRRQAVDRVFGEALERSDDQRQAYMTTLRERDPALHDEVARLLQMSDRARDLDELVRSRLSDTLLHEIADEEADSP